MRVVFMGTPQFAATILTALLASDHQVVGVVTRPDAIRGRGKKLIPSPVKEVALEAHIPVLEYSSLRSIEAYNALVEFSADVFCVAAYGCILPKNVLELPRFGCLNAHASLLPRWRGAAPIERALLAGDECAGCSIMQMEEGLDTGCFTESVSIPILEKTSEALTEEIALAGGKAMVRVLDKLSAGDAIQWQVQDEKYVTYADKLSKSEFELSPNNSVSHVLLRTRAAGSSHPCRCVIAGKPVTLLEAIKVDLNNSPCTSLAPGNVAFVAKRLFMGCADGVVEVLRVKPDGKKELDASAFAAGIQGIKKNGAQWSSIHGE